MSYCFHGLFPVVTTGSALVPSIRIIANKPHDSTGEEDRGFHVILLEIGSSYIGHFFVRYTYQQCRRSAMRPIAALQAARALDIAFPA